MRLLLLLLVTWGARSDGPKINMDATFDDFMKDKPKFCQAFACSGGEEPVPKRPLKLTSKGSCAGLGGAGINMFSATQKKDVLDACCDARQACDQICGTTLKLCDETFQKCTEDTCNAQADPAKRDECKKDANVHRLMTSLGDGCQKFVPSQTLGCQCLPAETAPKRRTAMLKDLYKKHAPDTPADKIENLASKSVDTPKKFAALLVKLLAKYPRIVQVLGDPQADMWNKIFEEGKGGPKLEKHSNGKKTVLGEDDDASEDDVLDLDDDSAGGGEL